MSEGGNGDTENELWANQRPVPRHMKAWRHYKSGRASRDVNRPHPYRKIEDMGSKQQHEPSASTMAVGDSSMTVQQGSIKYVPSHSESQDVNGLICDNSFNNVKRTSISNEAPNSLVNCPERTGDYKNGNIPGRYGGVAPKISKRNVANGVIGIESIRLSRSENATFHESSTNSGRLLFSSFDLSRGMSDARTCPRYTDTTEHSHSSNRGVRLPALDYLMYQFLVKAVDTSPQPTHLDLRERLRPGRMNTISMVDLMELQVEQSLMVS